MLFLEFKIGNEDYAVLGEKIVEIVELVNFTIIPGAPEYISGLMNLRGEVFPVLDLPYLFLKRKYKAMLSTRIIIINVKVKREVRRLGVIAENLTDTVNYEKKDIRRSGIKIPHLQYLGNVISTKEKIIHILEFEKILPEDLKISLYNDKK